jgi:hypothetical protein
MAAIFNLFISPLLLIDLDDELVGHDYIGNSPPGPRARPAKPALLQPSKTF